MRRNKQSRNPRNLQLADVGVAIVARALRWYRTRSGPTRGPGRV